MKGEYFPWLQQPQAAIIQSVAAGGAGSQSHD